MKTRIAYIVITLFFMPGVSDAQKIYFSGASEIILSFSNLEYNSAYTAAFPESEITNTNMRFALFYITERQVNFDFTQNIGMYTGLALRNTGMISDEVMILAENGFVPEDYKIVRRFYSIGIPLAIKLGALKDRHLLYVGGEYEFVFNYKEKYWRGSGNRKGSKIKYNEWFPSQTQQFLPSVFIGYQFSKFASLKFRYYFNDILNHDYTHDNQISDLTRYSKSQVFNVSLVIHPPEQDQKKKKRWENDEVIL